jgi:hypothetical protein
MNKYMIKHFGTIFFLMIFTITSCDKKAIHEFYVQNNCEDTIIVNILDYKNNLFSTDIALGMESLVYSGKTLNDVYEDEITYFIKDINIKKGDKMLNKNLLDYHIWRFEKISRLEAKSYLTINPEDFEDE